MWNSLPFPLEAIYAKSDHHNNLQIQITLKLIKTVIICPCSITSCLFVTTCHIQYTFLSLCKFGSRENLQQNTRTLKVHHFRSSSSSISKNTVGTFSGLGRCYSTSGLDRFYSCSSGSGVSRILTIAVENI